MVKVYQIGQKIRIYNKLNLSNQFTSIRMDLSRKKNQLPVAIVKGVNYIVPNVICKLLASTTILINLWWSRNQQVQLMGMGVASLFSQALGYLLIISLNLGLGYQIGRKRDKPEQVGIFYQRALFMNFVICAFIVTPLLYISKRVVGVFVHVDNSMAGIIGQYLFQIVPSIYCFAYYDTTQTYLLAQYHFLAPLVINIFAVFCHFFLISHLGAAWSKNFTDLGCCIAIYVFLNFRKRKLESWIQWDIQCIKNWSVHLKFVKNIGLSTYLQAFYFMVYSLMAFNIPRSQLICHICFLNISQIFITIIIGLKEGLLINVSYVIKHNLLNNYRQEAKTSLKIFLAVTLTIILIMLLYVDDISSFFMASEKAQQVFFKNCWILFISLLIDSFSLSLGTFLKALDKNYTALKIQGFFYSFAIMIGTFLCYHQEMGFLGLWFGWVIGNSLGCLSMLIMLRKAQKNFITFIEYKSQPTIEENNEEKAGVKKLEPIQIQMTDIKQKQQEQDHEKQNLKNQ